MGLGRGAARPCMRGAAALPHHELHGSASPVFVLLHLLLQRGEHVAEGQRLVLRPLNLLLHLRRLGLRAALVCVPVFALPVVEQLSLEPHGDNGWVHLEERGGGDSFIVYFRIFVFFRTFAITPPNAWANTVGVQRVSAGASAGPAARWRTDSGTHRKLRWRGPTARLHMQPCSPGTTRANQCCPQGCLHAPHAGSI